MSGEREPVPYWHDDQSLGEVYLGHGPRLVRVRSHTETETYRSRASETLVTLREREGLSTYIQSQLYLNAPPPSGREHRVADAQAWHYPADRTLVLWELILEPPFQHQAEPREDLGLRSLWVHYERLLLARFPADQLLTTWEDSYPQEQWTGLLTALGYHRTSPGVFRKIPPTEPHATA